MPRSVVNRAHGTVFLSQALMMCRFHLTRLSEVAQKKNVILKQYQ